MGMPEIKTKEGDIDCPICFREAEVRTSSKGKPYVICEHCGFQGFARMPDACDMLRAKIKKPKGANDDGTEKADKKDQGKDKAGSAGKSGDAGDGDDDEVLGGLGW